MDRNTNTNAGMTTLTPEYFVKRWSDPQSRPLIKFKLIDKTGCCCAQGDVLRCAGYSDQQLRDITQKAADREVARLLGITIAESVLIRVINDSEDGCPQDVFKAPEKVLGPHHRLWTAFARHIDQMTPQDWERVAEAWTAAEVEARAAAWDAAWEAARATEGTATASAAGTAARAAAWVEAGVEVGPATRAAAWELIGWSRLKEPFFLKMFFDDPQAWVKSIEEADGGAA